jgi:hypothetical protein
MHVVTAVLLVGLGVALLPLEIVGVALAVSGSTLLTAAYALRLLGATAGLPVGRLVAAVRPPAIAAVTMALVLYPVEHALLHAAERPAAAGLALLAVEGLAAAAVYGVVLRLVAPDVVGEIRAALATARPRRSD